MNSKKMVIATFSLLLCALLTMGTINFAIDPLFQYHKPWFGLEPYIVTPNYQNAGMAKTFDYENAVVGNSLSQNFVVSDLEDTLGGKTVKLTSSGMYVVHWVPLLEIMANRADHPKKILMSLDPYYFTVKSEEPKEESPLPLYLFDNNYFNDVEYLFNFTLTKNYTYRSIESNMKNNIPDYSELYMWGGEGDSGKELALRNYYIEKEKYFNKKCLYTEGNLRLLKTYIERMPDTQFIFFCAPYSVLYWYDIIEEGLFEEYKKAYETVFRFMSPYDNVSVYFWTDSDMLSVVSDLNNYKDSYHYGAHISKDILKRIKANEGILPKNEDDWQVKLNEYFSFLKTYNYSLIFEE